ncbi:AcrR family transcriptional regulator [Rhodoligotrophos appendicifer]|uniref:TetR/AcrR family transcriptional regulator n=1 Tax=Rhodoligotrophos appendicifer TaxID=987056 RepID=UPI001184F284|nr:TetR/AcrR family transcriptional regulator [Rhodoligotrophos appendicifer]
MNSVAVEKPSRPPKRTAPARRQPKKSEVTRARILDAAAHIFYHKGYALTRLSDIAKRARTQTSSIYYYFESREAIVAEVLRIANEKTSAFVLGAIAEMPPDTKVRDKIKAAIRGHFEIVLSGDQYTSAHMRIFDQIPPKLREHFLRVLDENAGVWRQLFAEAKATGEIREDLDLSVVRLLLLGMMNWSIEWYKPGRMTPEQIADQAAILLFEGIGKPWDETR